MLRYWWGSSGRSWVWCIVLGWGHFLKWSCPLSFPRSRPAGTDNKYDNKQNKDNWWWLRHTNLHTWEHFNLLRGWMSGDCVFNVADILQLSELCKCKSCVFQNLYTISIISTIISVCVELSYLRSLSNQYKLALGLANIQYPLPLSSPHKQKVTQRDWKMLCQPFLDWA